MKPLTWKILSIVGLLFVSIIIITPSVVPVIPSWWTNTRFLPTKKIQLGLDLQGGMHLTLEVQTKKAVESEIERTLDDLREQLRKAGIKYTKIERSTPSSIAATIIGLTKDDALDDLLSRQFSSLKLEKNRQGDTLELQLSLDEKSIKYIEDLAAKQAMETIRNRIDQFGVSEPEIARQGIDRILIQLPGIKDPQRAINLIGRTALLEFRLLDEEHDLQDALKGTPPAGSEILYAVSKPGKENIGSQAENEPYLVRKRTALTGKYLTDARVQIDSQYNEPYVLIDFDKLGAKKFGDITEANVKKRLAIVLDNRVYSAPVIQERIPDGHARITGKFSSEEAHDLAIALRAGALSAPVKILEQRTVGPSLGRDSISEGILSMWVGGVLVILLVLVYYKASGIIADIALLMNVVLIGACLAALQATLTLPGLAGIILTVGMAVDGNVLIYERIREELRKGKTPGAAVAAGFDRATLTVLDSNTTTFIAALVLLQFGTGPVKGFAITLIIGVLSSVFTAVVASRVMFEYLLFGKKVKTLSI